MHAGCARQNRLRSETVNRSASQLLEEFKEGGLITELRGPDQSVTGVVAAMEDCGPQDLVFLSKPKAVRDALQRKPAVAVINKEVAEALDKDPELAALASETGLLVTSNLNLAQSRIKLRYADRDLADEGWERIHPSAVIHPSVQIPDDAVVGPLAVIGRNTEIGAGARILARVVIEHNAKIGARTVIHPGAFVGYDCEIGADCIIQPGAVIGSEGFGFAQDEQSRNHRIPQTGKVVLEDRCVVSACVCIDRAAYRETRIRAGVLFDNLCHIAHNVEIGENSIILGQTGIAGSAKIGKRVILSGQSGVLDHIEVADDGIFLHRPAVVQNVKKGGVYAGNPLTPIHDYTRVQVAIKKLPDWKRRLDRLERQPGAPSD